MTGRLRSIEARLDALANLTALHTAQIQELQKTAPPFRRTRPDPPARFEGCDGVLYVVTHAASGARAIRVESQGRVWYAHSLIVGPSHKGPDYVRLTPPDPAVFRSITLSRKTYRELCRVAPAESLLGFEPPYEKPTYVTPCVSARVTQHGVDLDGSGTVTDEDAIEMLRAGARFSWAPRTPEQRFAGTLWQDAEGVLLTRNTSRPAALAVHLLPRGRVLFECAGEFAFAAEGYGSHVRVEQVVVQLSEGEPGRLALIIREWRLRAVTRDYTPPLALTVR